MKDEIRVQIYSDYINQKWFKTIESKLFYFYLKRIFKVEHKISLTDVGS